MTDAQPLPRRIEATNEDLDRGREAAHAIAADVLGHDPGPLTAAASLSQYVYLGADVVVKLAHAAAHDRLDRETTLASHLPPGLGAPLLASGRRQVGRGEVRYGLFTRVPGASPGVGLPDLDAGAAQHLIEQAVARLTELHAWTPAGVAERTLRESPVFEGFNGRDALLAEADRIAAFLPRRLTDGLAAIADGGPERVRADVPVHADCDWGNWLVHERSVTALLDFERARFGEPADDWVLLALTSGQHIDIVLSAIVAMTATEPRALRAACELRHAAFLAEDIRFAVERAPAPAWLGQRIRGLEEVVVGRAWWQPAVRVAPIEYDNVPVAPTTGGP
ncbi:MAG TPA: phosphotransferase [Micromonosporaceae bacterium]|nr:phosphotransferase [Micromonosporaceae bacterium]